MSAALALARPVAVSPPRPVAVEDYTLLALDFDGVISVNQTKTGKKLSAIERLVPARVARLNAIVARTRCRIVVSSTWRYNPKTDEGASIDKLEEWLSAVGFVGKLHGITPTFGTPKWQHELAAMRGSEILAWVAEQAAPPRALAVLDDVALHGPIAAHLVQTDEKTGLTDEDVEVVVARLLGRW